MVFRLVTISPPGCFVTRARFVWVGDCKSSYGEGVVGRNDRSSVTVWSRRRIRVCFDRRRRNSLGHIGRLRLRR